MGISFFLGVRPSTFEFKNQRLILTKLEDQIRQRFVGLTCAICAFHDVANRDVLGIAYEGNSVSAPFLISLLSEQTGADDSEIVAKQLIKLPRVPSGKIDRGAITALFDLRIG